MGLVSATSRSSADESVFLKPIHSTIDPKSIEKYLEKHYELPKPLDCRFYLRGTNDIYFLKAGKTIYFVRLNRHGYRKALAIEDELKILIQLQETDVNVATPITDQSGKLYHKIKAPEGERVLIVFKEAEGKPDNHPQPNRLELVGKYLALLHSELRRINIPGTLPKYDLDFCIKRSTTGIIKFLHKDPVSRNLGIFYQNLALKLKTAFAKYDLSKIRAGGIHGDFIFGNFVYGEDGNITAYDFDRIGQGWQIFDVATYLGHLTTHSATPNRSALFRRISAHFLAGYESLTPISDTEREIIPLFYLLRRIHMRSLCCMQFVDWSNQFMSPSNWKSDVSKSRAWARTFCGIEV